jgi:hypothetical protein
MDKLTIMPQVTVYRNLIPDEDLDFLVEQIRDSQKDYVEMDKTDPALSTYFDFHGPQPQERQDGTLISTWTPWYTYGLRSIWGSPESLEDKPEHVRGHKIILDAISKSHFDYIEDWKDNGRWTYDIQRWDPFSGEDEEANNMALSTLEILQHRLNLEEDYTIGVHTDWHDHRKDEPGPKQILTYTVYLNDDYEGGEIDFVDEENDHLIVYKPKRGDVTVFPAGKPYWHGARAVKSDPNKIFIRTFSVYRNPVSAEWIRGLKLYGVQPWIKIQNDKVKEYADTGNVGRQIVLEGGSPSLDTNLLPLYIKKETYIDGRTL